jgi:RNA polymerase sigma factor (sigma-70 family)
MPDLDDDVGLVHAFLQGDEVAFTDIYRRYAPLVFAVALRSLGDRDQAEEVVASTFAHAAQRLGSLREPSKLRSWLLAVARAEVNHLLRSIVRERRRRDRVATVRPIEVDEANTAEISYARDVLAIAREGLSADDQVLLGLVLSEVSGRELADALGIDLGAADTRKSRLYDRLRLAVEVYWVTRPGRNECPELRQLLAHRNETAMSRALCRVVERHCRICEVCEEQRKAVAPLALLGLAPVPIFPAHLLATSGAGLIVRLGTPSIPISQWRNDGFPRARSHVALFRHPVGLGVAAMVIVLAGAGVAVGITGHRGTVAPNKGVIESSTTLPTQLPSIAKLPSTSTSTVSTTTSSTTPSVAKNVAVPTTTHPLHAVTTKNHTKKHRKKAHPSTTIPAPITTQTSSTTAPSSLVIDTASVNFGSSATSAVIAFHDVGASLVWTASANETWLAVTPSSGTLAPGGSSSLTVEMNRASAPTGVLVGAVTLTTVAGSVSVAVSATEDPPPSVTVTAVPTCLPSQPATFAANVTAAAVVSSVIVSLTVPGETSPTEEPMSLSGGSYEATVAGPFPRTTGAATWSIVATDDDGKVSSPPTSGTIPYGSCG